MATELAVEWLGTLPYPEALELQMKCVEARRTGSGPDRLLLVEHPPVITLGRSARPENLRATRAGRRRGRKRQPLGSSPAAASSSVS